jgi:hypothetical protein
MASPPPLLSSESSGHRGVWGFDNTPQFLYHLMGVQGVRNNTDDTVILDVLDSKV